MRESERDSKERKKRTEEIRDKRFRGYQIREQLDKFSSRKKQRSSVKTY